MRLFKPPAGICVLVATLVAGPVCADEFDALNFVLSQAITYDANIFRTPDSAGPQPGTAGKSDRTETTSIGFKINKPYAQQRFQIDYAQTRTRFDTFNFLNSDAVNYRAAWLWAFTPHLTGTLGTDKTQSQVSFAQAGGTQRNVRTSTNHTFSIDGWLGGGWHLLAGLGTSEATTEQAVISQPAFESRRIEAGLRYEAASGNSLGFTRRLIPADTTNQRLDPVNLIETNYRDAQSELKLHWKPSGQSTFDGTLMRSERVNEHFSQRDFAATVGEIRYGWTPTGKLQFNLSASRAISPYLAFGNTIQNSSYVVDQALVLGAVLQVDAKVAFNFTATRKLSDFGGPVFAVAGPARSDDFRSLQIGANWSPLRSLTLSANVERDRRDTNAAAFQFSDNIASISAALNF